MRNRGIFVFDIDDFNGATVGGEWLVPLGEYFEAGAGVGFSRRTVPSVYADFVDVGRHREIEQDFRLRLLPVAFTVRVLPLRQTSPVQPYFGGGLALISWRYSESGDFVDFQRQNAIFRGQFVASGSETGPVVLGGIRFAGDSVSGGFEVRYLSARTPVWIDRFRSCRLTRASISAAGRIVTRYGSAGRFRADQRYSELVSLVDCRSVCTDATPPPSQIARHPCANAGSCADPPGQHVAAFRLFFDQHPARVTARARSPSPSSQMTPLPSCTKSAMAKPSRDSSCM